MGANYISPSLKSSGNNPSFFTNSNWSCYLRVSNLFSFRRSLILSFGSSILKLKSPIQMTASYLSLNRLESELLIWICFGLGSYNLDSIRLKSLTRLLFFLDDWPLQRWQLTKQTEFWPILNPIPAAPLLPILFIIPQVVWETSIWDIVGRIGIFANMIRWIPMRAWEATMVNYSPKVSESNLIHSPFEGARADFWMLFKHS